MPRAALLSIHARVEGTEPPTWEDTSLVQLWGRDTARTSLRHEISRSSRSGDCRTEPPHARGRTTSPPNCHTLLGGKRGSLGESGRALGVNPNRFRYAAPTGTVVIRWDGAR